MLDSFAGLSLFKQLAIIMMLGPLAVSVWALIDDWKRPWATRASEQTPGAGDPAGDVRNLRKAA